MRKIIIFILFLFLIGCDENPQTQVESNQQQIGIIPTVSTAVSPGKSSIVGQAVSIASSSPQPLPDTAVRLAIVFWNEDETDGAFIIDEASSPTVFTDELGGFVFTDLEPQDYVIVIGELYGQNVILSESDGAAKIFSTTADEVLNVGVLQVNLEAAPDYSATPSTIQSVPPYPVPTNPASDSAYPPATDN